MMLALILIGLALSALAPMMFVWLKHRTGWLLALYPAAFFVWLQFQTVRIAAGNDIREVHRFFPSMSISMSFFLDGLSILFGLLISGIGTLVLIYASGYLQLHPMQGRFFALISFENPDRQWFASAKNSSRHSKRRIPIARNEK